MAENIGPALSRGHSYGEIRTDNLTTLAAGTRVGKYEIIAVLGAGGFGITYCGRDLQLDRDVAIKEYLPASFAVRQPDLVVLPRSTEVAETFRWGRERFLDEARTLARLTDARGVVDVFDFLEANGTAYMVMALVRGETLEARLKREGRLSQPVVEQILHPLLDGLEKVHAANFLHRDIKPANILIDADGQPTLIDFGAARVALQGHTQTMTAIYTPGYAAFEQFTSARLGPWTDIYAVGATLYHCITGAVPPSASDRMVEDTLVPAVETGKGRYAPRLLVAIDEALKLKPAERPQSIGAWRRVFSASPPSKLVEPIGALTRRMDAPAVTPARTRRRARRAMWAALGLTLAGATAAGSYVWYRSAETSGRQALEEEARAQAEVRRRAEETAARQAMEERARAEAAAKRHADEERARADAAAARQRAEDDERRRAAATARNPVDVRDCPDCPELVRIPPGSFLMGTDAAEEQREGVGDGSRGRGLPRKRIAIRTEFWMSKTEVTVAQFRSFVGATNRDMGAKCWTWAGKWMEMTGRIWRDPGFPQSDAHPVTCVSSSDANAYAEWLSRRTGRKYRLPSEAEWEYAARAGTTAARYWGDAWGDGDKYANIHSKRGGTIAVGSLIPNAFGLYDMLGNVWEWTADAWNKDLASQPDDGSPRVSGGGGLRVLRGGSWVEDSSVIRVGYREAFGAGNRGDRFGIRLVRAD